RGDTRARSWPLLPRGRRRPRLSASPREGGCRDVGRDRDRRSAALLLPRPLREPARADDDRLVTSDQVLVGLDVGTTGVQALAVSPVGDVLAQAEGDYPLSTPRLGWSEPNAAAGSLAPGAALARLGAGRP